MREIQILFRRIMTAAVLSVIYAIPASAGPSPIQSPGYLAGYAEADSVRHITFFFKIYESTIEGSYMNNQENLELVKRIISTDTLPLITSIAITATSSPEGNGELNRNLASLRADAVETLFFNNAGYDSSKISKIAHANSWTDIKSAVEKDPNIPNLGGLKAILNDSSIQNDAVKGWKIKILGNGSTYDYLKSNILPYFRTGTVTITTRQAVSVTEYPERDTLTRCDLEDNMVLENSDTTIIDSQVALSSLNEYRTVYPIAFRTNLLFNAVGAPNLGVEVPIGKRFSVAADFAYAYWRINNRYALQTIQGGIEAKYWLSPSDRPLTGWNAGAYGMYSSRYDVQWIDGYQGDGFWSAGIGAGYSTPISNRLNLEFALAGGYFYTPEVRHYHWDPSGNLLWKETRYNVERITLTKVKVNLVWLIKKKKTILK